MPNRKLEIVARLMPMIPMEWQTSVDHAMKTWWVNIRDDGGLRLTEYGYEVMHDVLKLESWHLDLSEQTDNGTFRSKINKRTILDLDRKMKWPYYLEFNVRKKTRRIIFFGARDAMMATMYGDLERWLKSI